MRRTHIDGQPGPLPDIRPAGTSVTFEFDRASGNQGAVLVIRCDERGGVFARIVQPPTTGRGRPRRRGSG